MESVRSENERFHAKRRIARWLLVISIAHARRRRLKLLPDVRQCLYANRLDRSFLLAPCPTAIAIAFVISSQRNCLFYFPFALSFFFSFSSPGSRHLLICIFQEANRRIGSGFQMSQVKAISPSLLFFSSSSSPIFLYLSLSLFRSFFISFSFLSLALWVWTCGVARSLARRAAGGQVDHIFSFWKRAIRTLKSPLDFDLALQGTG